MLILAILVGIVSIVCWIITLTKMFPAGVGTGIVGLICGLYALIWSWQHRSELPSWLPPVWTLCVVINVALNIALRSTMVAT